MCTSDNSNLLGLAINMANKSPLYKVVFGEEDDGKKDIAYQNAVTAYLNRDKSTNNQQILDNHGNVINPYDSQPSVSVQPSQRNTTTVGTGSPTLY